MDLRRIAINLSDPERATLPSPESGRKQLDEFLEQESLLGAESAAIIDVMDKSSSTTNILFHIAEWLSQIKDLDGAKMVRDLARKFAVHEKSH